jgi:hypothetical protein
MFDYPLMIPGKTEYDDLGVGPEATEQEIRDAIAERNAAWQDEKRGITRRIAAVQRQVAGLKEAEAALAALRKAQPEAGTDELASAQRTLAGLEARAIALEPRYRELLARVSELADQIDQSSQNPLEKPDKRREYDRANAPLALLKLVDCTRDGFVEDRRALAQVRHTLALFLAARGEEVFHPSDVTRDDFTRDFQPDPDLDRP